MGPALSKSEVFETSLSATRASISVLLVFGFGAVAAKYKHMTPEAQKNISHLIITLFLPALLFSEIGPQASASHLARNWIILVLAVWFQLLSYVAGIVLRKLFKIPQWVIPCLVFNNVTSLPLLLFSSLDSQGALDDLAGGGDTTDALSRRFKGYILIHALVCNLARFLFGPILLSSNTRSNLPHPQPDPPQPQSKIAVSSTPREDFLLPDDPERQPLLQSGSSRNLGTPQSERRTERSMSLLHKTWYGLKSSLNPPLMGGLAALIVGVIPFLHSLVLSESSPIAVFAESIRRLGNLYSTLQMFVLGGQLYSRRGSKADMSSFFVILIWRFVAMPAVSISTIYFLRNISSPGVINPDPMLDFVLAVVPVGPPAITLAAIAGLSDISSETEGYIYRTLMYSYVVTPLVSFPVTAALTVVKKLHGIRK